MSKHADLYREVGEILEKQSLKPMTIKGKEEKY